MLLNTDTLLKIKQKIDYVKYFEELGFSPHPSGNSFWINCPLHSETTSSFQFNLSTMAWRCWGGCNTRGDIFDFYQQYFHKTWMQSVVELAEYVGVEIEFDEEYVQKNKERKELIAFNCKLMKYFQNNLQNSPKALKYLEERNIIEASILEFKLGLFNPKTILNYIKPEEYDIAVKCGVLKYDENGDIKPYSKVFRLIFPYLSNGYPLTFHSRCFGDFTPKYLNFHNNDIIEKKDLLYGIDTAKKAIERFKNVFVVEGNIDVITAWQNGIPNVIGVSSIKLSDSQILQLKRYCKTFYLVVEDEKSERQIITDYNNKGTINTYQKIKDLIPFAKVKIIKLYEDKKMDLDDYLNTHTRQEFIDLKNKAPLYNEFVILNTLKNATINDIDDKIKYINLLKGHLLSIPAGMVRDEHVKTLSKLIDIPEITIHKQLRRKEEFLEKKTLPQNAEKSDRKNISVQKFLIALLFYPEIDIFFTMQKYEKYELHKYLDIDYLNLYNTIIGQINSGLTIKEVEQQLTTDVNFKKLLIDCLFKIDMIFLEEAELDGYLQKQLKYLTGDKQRV